MVTSRQAGPSSRWGLLRQPGEVHRPMDPLCGQRELLVLAPDGELIVFGMALSDGTR